MNPDPNNTLENAINNLRTKLSQQEPLPHILLAFQNEQIVGVASLKLYELYDGFPKTPYWLGSVYVDKSTRGEGIASTLVKAIEDVAISMDISTLHLATERLDGGLYQRLGWQPVTKVMDRGDEVLIINKQL